MVGNTILYKDNNLNECKARILDTILAEDEGLRTEEASYVITKYLCVCAETNAIVLVDPIQIKKVL